MTVRTMRRRALAGLCTVAAGLGLAMATSAPSQAADSQPTIVTDEPSVSTPRVVGGQCYGQLAFGDACRRIAAMVKVGNWIYAVGSIDVVANNDGSNPVSGFSNIMRFNATTKALDPTFQPQVWKNNVVDGAATSIAASADGSTIYVGGIFTKASSGPGQATVTRKGLAAFSTSTGALITSFNGNICQGGGACHVFDVRLIGPSLWVGGDFSMVAKQTRNALASVDPTTGALTTAVTIPVTGQAITTNSARVIKIKPNPAQTKAIILGNFLSVGGQTREEVAELDLNPSTGGATGVDPWYSPNSFHTAVLNCNKKHYWPRDVDWSPTGSAFTIVGTGGGGGHPYPAPCDAATRWNDNGSPNAVPVYYNHTQIDTIGSVCDVGPYTYVGGHFKSLNQEVRINGVLANPPKAQVNETHYGVAAIDSSTGLAVTDWNHSDQTGRGEGWLSVLCVPGTASTGGGVYFGGDSVGMNGIPQVQRLAYFAPTNTSTTPDTIGFDGQSSAVSKGATSLTVSVPSGARTGDAMVLVSSFSVASATVTTPSGWTLLRTQKLSGGMVTTVWTRTAAAGDAGSTIPLAYSASGKATAVVSAYSGAASVSASSVTTSTDTGTATHTTPTATVKDGASWVLSYWSDRSATAATSWTAPSGVTTRATAIGSGSNSLSSLLADSGATVGAGSYGGLSATAAGSGAAGVTATIVLAPSYN